MRFPFTTEQFIEVFSRYNQTVWPAQWLLAALAIAVLALALRHSHAASRVAFGLLAAMWLWMGAVYHLGFFSTINPAAYGFAALFLLQALLLAAEAVRRGSTLSASRREPQTVAGWMLVAHALVIYPAIGFWLGRRYPGNPTFGLPCPTTIFTLGVLLWVRPRLPVRLLIIPLLWSLVGTVAALQLGIREDFSLIFAAAVVGMVYFGRRPPVPAISSAA